MDQKSFSVLLSLIQSSPFDGGEISGAAGRSGAENPATAVRSNAIPTTIFFIELPFGNLIGRNLARILPKKHGVQS